jgi:hypothetical protein
VSFRQSQGPCLSVPCQAGRSREGRTRRRGPQSGILWDFRSAARITEARATFNTNGSCGAPRSSARWRPPSSPSDELYYPLENLGDRSHRARAPTIEWPYARDRQQELGPPSAPEEGIFARSPWPLPGAGCRVYPRAPGPLRGGGGPTCENGLSVVALGCWENTNGALPFVAAAASQFFSNLREKRLPPEHVSQKVRAGPSCVATGAFEQEHVVASMVSEVHDVFDLAGRHHSARLYKHPASVNSRRATLRPLESGEWSAESVHYIE